MLLFDSSEFEAGGLHTLLHTTMRTHKTARWRHSDRVFACVAQLVPATPELLESPPVVVSSLQRRCMAVRWSSHRTRSSAWHVPSEWNDSHTLITPAREIHTGFKGKINRLVWKDEPCDADRSLLRKATASTDARADFLAHPEGARATGKSFLRLPCLTIRPDLSGSTHPP